MLATLIRQNFFINQFPGTLTEKQSIVNKEIQTNQALNEENIIKKN